jgi:HSP20 family protein
MNTLTRWNPFRKSSETDIDSWRLGQRLDPSREFEEMFRSMQRALALWPARGSEPITLAEWSPSVDISETDAEYQLKAELPDVRKQDIKVSIENGTLLLSGERKVEREEKGLTFHRMERAFGRFERAFALPENADREKITSEYKEGILTVHLPKNSKAQHATQQIQVH